MNDARWLLILSLLLVACGSKGASSSTDASAAPDADVSVDVPTVDVSLDEDVATPDVTVDSNSTADTAAPESPQLELPDLAGARTDSVIAMPGLVGVQPAVAVGQDGQPLVVFTATPGAEGDLSIYASFAGQETQLLKSSPPGQRNEPSTCRLSDGGFVAVWSYDGQAVGNTLGVEGAVLDAGGALVTTFVVTTEVEGNHWLGHVGCDPSGGFTVVGSRTDTDDTTFGVFAQAYNAAGEPLGDAFGVNPTPEGTQVQPVAGIGPDGSGVVLYEDAPEDDSYVLTARAFDGSGTVGDTFVVLGQAGVDCLKPAVAISPGGVVAYAGNLGTQVHVLTAPSAAEPEPAMTWLQTTGSKGLPALTFVGRDDVLALAMIENLTGAGEPKVQVQLLGAGVDPATSTVLLGSDPTLPPYPPSLDYAGGTLAVAWTQRTGDGYEIHMSQFEASASER
jgi:hypothetical protein